MLKGLSGSLLSREALQTSIRPELQGLLGEDTLADARRRLRAWHRAATATVGPTAGARMVFDRVADPLVEVLAFDTAVCQRTGRAPYAVLRAGGRDAAVLLVTGWGGDATVAWRDAVRHGIGHGVRWCFCLNGPALRVFDAVRVYSRRHAEFDIARTLAEDDTWAVFWGLLRAGAFAVPGLPLLDRAVAIGERHRAAVGDSLKTGVHQALARLVRAFLSAHTRRPPSNTAALDESLIVIYRVLFLLFAEARDLVPHWHATYREAYTLESMRPAIEGAARPRGIWEGLQAMARLAHRGCRAGALRVPPFNGRLFSPAEAPMAEGVRLDDGAVRDALLVLTTRPSRRGRERISYADLGVEQLGAIYEHVLDYRPGAAGEPGDLARSGRRKATGTFYTPRPLTEYLVRRTLGPLVRNASPEQILELRVLDPSMGSGAFLVAACRHLASAYEQALIRDGVLSAADISPSDRTGFRRLVAQRCLFGVDLNPMAVQLGRLSLWLATLAADRPLTFLDHHLRSGNSLVGASLADIQRQPPLTGSRTPSSTPLFDSHPLASDLQSIVGPRLAMAREPDDTLEAVRRKEMVLARLSGNSAPLHRWKNAADLWCAGWFTAPVDGRTFRALLHDVLSGSGDLPAHVVEPLLSRARGVAAERGFFHWTIEYPEAFYEQTGVPCENPGFDAVLGNPPWDMLRDDDRGGMEPAAQLMRFARRSGIYRLQGSGHANLYQLFVERALSLVRAGGRLGLIVPSGLACDQGSASLRRELMTRTAIDTFMTFENRAGIFPIHRGLKFTLLTTTPGRATEAIPVRSGLRETDALDSLPDDELDRQAVALGPALLERVSGPGLAIPDIRSPADLSLVSRIAWSHPALGDAEWSLRFGRELNATEDRPHFSTGAGLPVIEGKHIHPFDVRVSDAHLRISPAMATELLGERRPFGRARLGYRDVASASNRLTLIAAIVPSGVVTTHTVFVVRTPPDLETQHFLCAMFNSYVANHLVRMRVGTHVGAAVIDRLPIPKPPRDSAPFLRLASLARDLAAGKPCGAEQQALAAQLYGLDADEFARVVDTFTLVPIEERAAALAAFRYIVVR